MKPFNKEQLDILAKWEESFFTATVSKYYRNISSKSLDTIKGVYDEAADKPYSANWSCNHCVLAFLQTVGKPVGYRRVECIRVCFVTCQIDHGHGLAVEIDS